MSRRLRWVGGIGLALIMIGIALPVGFHAWMQTRTWVALDIPISTAAGHIRTPEFEINLEGDYWIYIDVDRDFKPDVLECLLGLSPYYGDCAGHPSILRTSWHISNAGKEIAGDHNTPAVRVGPYYRVGRAIGSFAADKSKHYVLDFDILQDASALNGGNPRLKVEELGGAYLSYSSLEDDLSSLGLLIGIVGIVFVIVALVGRARANERSRIPLTSVGPQPRELFFDSIAISGVPAPPNLEKKKLSVSFCFGAVLFCAGVTSFSSMTIWLRGRYWVPVDLPVSLARGHMRTGPFKINVTALYGVSVEYSLPSERAANCFWYDRGKASWSLYRNGVHVEDFSDPSPYASFGGFDADPGIYDLDLRIDSDTGCLDAGHPRLRVFTERHVFEDELNPWLWLSALCIATGASMSVLALAALSRKERSAGSSLTGSPTIGLHFSWAQKLPLKSPFSRLPSFGLLAGMVFALVFLTMRLIDADAFDRFHARGIYVQVAQSPSIQKNPVSQPSPPVIRIEPGAPGSAPKLYLNSVPLPWTELERSLQRGIGRPSDCRVLVTANENTAWNYALQAMDTARGLGCKVVLLTSDPEKTSPR